MSEPLDEQYLTWLYARIGSVRVTNPSRTHWSLMRKLYKKEFVWIVPNDDNRVEDGRDLRYEFLHDGRLKRVDPEWMDLSCSVLELFIGIAKRAAFETDIDESDWFWEILTNLGLNTFTDGKMKRSEAYLIETDDIIDTFIWRTYAPDGTGGLFPLKEPENDQREVEIWYQLCAYILERGG